MLLFLARDRCFGHPVNGCSRLIPISTILLSYSSSSFAAAAAADDDDILSQQ